LLICRPATPADLPLLARMNQALIRDEGHRNNMNLIELEQRMGEWLKAEYHALLIQFEDEIAGYVLYRRDPGFIYLRHFYIVDGQRRRGLGRAAMQWLRIHEWPDFTRIRLDVLIQNSIGIDFWRSVGFKDYCITMEQETAAPCLPPSRADREVNSE
jgi:predicted acetyltransferase